MLRDVPAGRPDRDADFGDHSLDFGRALDVGQSGQRQELGPLWGPGMDTKVQETPSAIMSHNLHIWRKNNVRAPAAQAAEELDKLYESLPQEVFDLTFQDMIDRNHSLKQRSPGKRSPGKEDHAAIARNGARPRSPKTSSGVNGGNARENGQVQYESKENRTSDPSQSITAKLTTMALSPRAAFSPLRKGQQGSEQLGKPVEKRSKSPSKSKRDGLYSASTTPTASFRRESPFASPRLSPRASFSDYVLQMDRQSFEREIARSARHLGIEADLDRSDGIPHADGLPPRQALPLPTINGARTTTTRPIVVPQSNSNDCSSCSAKDLVFKTNCMACGKTFCLRCMNLKTRETRGGRKCTNHCEPGRPVSHGHIDRSHVRRKGRGRSGMGCWPLGICMRPQIKRVPKLNASSPRVQH